MISGHAIGVFINSDDQPATGNVVQGNYLGTNVEGSADVANDIGLLISASGNTVGGPPTAPAT